MASRSDPIAHDAAIEDEWLTRQFAVKERMPLQFYLAAGVYEDNQYTGVLVPTRHLRDVLLAKGYPVTYREFVGSHELMNWSGTLAEGLVQLIGTKAKSVK